MTLINPAILFAFVIRAASAGLAYLLFAIVARNTSPSDYGSFAIFFTVISASSTVSPLGQQSIAFKYLPSLVSQRDSRLEVVFRRSLLISLAGGLIFCVPTILVILTSIGRDGPVLATISVPIVIVCTSVEYLFAAHRALGSIYSTIFSKELLWRLVFVSLLILTIGSGYELGTQELALFLLVGFSGALLLLSVGVASRLSGFPKPPANGCYSISSKETAIYFGITTVGAAITHLDTLLLGLTVFREEVPVYFSAQRVTQVLLFFSYSFSMVKAPEISVAFHKNTFSEIGVLSQGVGRKAGLFVAVACVILFVFAGEILSLFNPAFSGGADTLRILCIGPLVLTLGGLHSWIPPICGLELEYLVSRIAIMVIFFAIKLLVVSYGSIISFAAVSSAELCAITAVGVLLTRMRLGIWIV